jgi:uncharacterized protein
VGSPATLVAGDVLDTIAQHIALALREGFFMFWVTLWALVLGFTLSGAVQVFVSRSTLEHRLGNHRPLAVVFAAGFGMASSSCSYAAAALTKTLFRKGADFISALVFMFASTNLVIELGIVLVVLMGWQFMAGEFFGGLLMIGGLALVGSAAFGARRIAAARRQVEVAEAAATAEGHDHGGAHDHHGVPASATVPAARRIRTAAGWSEAADATMADVTMLRKEILLGYVVAGFLATAVPTSAWNALFLEGHGFWTTLENVIVGPFIAIISFVCSIGNVPMAAALWSGGISFGGVMSFLFADLITFPLLLIYRRLYGPAMAVRMLVVFWALMSLAGLVTELVFGGLGLIPSTRPTVIAADHFQWNITTFLNVVFLGVFAVLYWLHRRGPALRAAGAVRGALGG